MIGRQWKYVVVAALALGAAANVWPYPAAESTGGALPPPALHASDDLAAAQRATRRETHRLHRNLEILAELRESPRSPLASAPPKTASEHPVASDPGGVTVALPPAMPQVPPPFTLIGIAERRTDTKPERFAILAWNDEPVIASEGVVVGSRYIVHRVEPRAVELIDNETRSMVRLTLQ